MITQALLWLLAGFGAIGLALHLRVFVTGQPIDDDGPSGRTPSTVRLRSVLPLFACLMVICKAAWHALEVEAGDRKSVV